MPQELFIVVTVDQMPGEDYTFWIKQRAEEVGRRLPEYQVVLHITQHESEAHNKNGVVREFLKNPNATWVWFIKEDLAWRPEDLVKLIEAKRPVIGALTTTKEQWPKWNVTTYDNDDRPDEAGVALVPEIGGNGLLIHRVAFAKILEKPVCRLDYRDDSTWQIDAAFFQNARVDFAGVSRLLEDEFFFEWMCREAGVGVFAHTGVKLKRVGANGALYPFAGQEPSIFPEPAPDAAEWPRTPIPGKIMIVLQYWDGDREQAYKLSEYINENSSGDYILSLRRSNPELKYPQGPNDLAFWIMKEAANYDKDIKAVLLIEPDCVPMCPDWIEKLSAEWDRAAGQGKLILGHWQKEHGGHINGNLMFDPNLARVIDLGAEPPKRPWDIAYPPIFEPLWARTGLIKNLYRMTNVTDEMIETPAVGNVAPVLLHGVRDQSVWDYLKRKL